MKLSAERCRAVLNEMAYEQPVDTEQGEERLTALLMAVEVLRYVETVKIKLEKDLMRRQNNG